MQQPTMTHAEPLSQKGQIVLKFPLLATVSVPAGKNCKKGINMGGKKP